MWRRFSSLKFNSILPIPLVVCCPWNGISLKLPNGQRETKCQWVHKVINSHPAGKCAMMRISDWLFGREGGRELWLTTEWVSQVFSVFWLCRALPWAGCSPPEPEMQLFVNSTNTIIIKGHKTPNSHHRNWSEIRMLLQLFSQKSSNESRGWCLNWFWLEMLGEKSTTPARAEKFQCSQYCTFSLKTTF